jgi:hypothetical protein
MKTKTFKFINSHEKGKVIFFGNVDFDFTKHNTLIKVNIDNKKHFNFYIEIEIIKINQVQKSIFELPFDGKFINIQIEANFNLDNIKVELLK